jgi:adenosylcobinamide-phosphate synthase
MNELGLSIVIFVGVILLDWWLGDPLGWPHPILYIGKLIQGLEIVIRKSKINLYLGGFILLGISLFSVLALITGLLYLAGWVHPLLRTCITIYLLYTALAAKCLDVEVRKVVKGLGEGLEEGRKYLSYLVGRDTRSLSEEGVIKGAIETTAENTIDGVLAPLFYMGIGFILGVPVQWVFAYKVVNTLDSMVGYMVEPYREIGYGSAKLDDVLNYIPARIGSVCMVISTKLIGLDDQKAWKILKRDRRNHKSPNCGYPESVIAGALDIQLGGNHIYFDQMVEKPTIGDKKKVPNRNMIDETVKIMYIAEVIMALLMIAMMIIVML